MLLLLLLLAGGCSLLLCSCPYSFSCCGPLQPDFAGQEIAQGCHKPIAVMKLLLVVEMARQDQEKLTFHRFMECLSSVGF